MVSGTKTAHKVLVTPYLDSCQMTTIAMIHVTLSIQVPQKHATQLSMMIVMKTQTILELSTELHSMKTPMVIRMETQIRPLLPVPFQPDTPHQMMIVTTLLRPSILLHKKSVTG